MHSIQMIQPIVTAAHQLLNSAIGVLFIAPFLTIGVMMVIQFVSENSKNSNL